MYKKNLYASSNFTLTSRSEQERIVLEMIAHKNLVTTRQLPHTFRFLKEAFPSVLTTTCFNQGDLPFDQEVRATEIAHLFEHVLLEFLCLEKLATGFNEAEFNGQTTWDWTQTARGVFQITIDLRSEESHLLGVALKKSTKLLEDLIHFNREQATLGALPAALDASQG